MRAGTSSTLHTEGAQHWEEVVPQGHPTRITVERVSGASRDEVQSFIAATSASLDDCVGPHAGKLTVRLDRRNGELATTFVKSASLDPLEEKCVLDALRRLAPTDPSTPTAQRAEGFISLISIEW